MQLVTFPFCAPSLRYGHMCSRKRRDRSPRAKLSVCGNHGHAGAGSGLGVDHSAGEGLEERRGLHVLKAKFRLPGRVGNVFTLLRDVSQLCE